MNNMVNKINGFIYHTQCLKLYLTYKIQAMLKYKDRDTP